jgi:hypothetical protein
MQSELEQGVNGAGFNFEIALRDDDLARSFASVRGYGLRTHESRQGRNAATVV